MRIAHLVPGSGGGFYCGNCIRDVAVTTALRRAGHDVVVVPLYLPLLGHDALVGDTPLFFGGINAWLQEHLPPFRHTPRWLDRIFDSEPLLRAAAARASSTQSRGLGPMTRSMLWGERGNQAKEASRLACWLAERVRPDVVHLSNALLLGLAEPIRHRTGAAIVCTLQDEQPWVDSMAGEWPARVWRAMGRRVGSVDRFVSVSHWYAGVMARRLGLGPQEIRVVPVGLEVSDYPFATPGQGPPVLGFVGRESEAEGLGVLVDAFLRLRAEGGHDGLELRVMGGGTSEDRGLRVRIERQVRHAGAWSKVRFLGDFHWERHRELLSTLSVLSVPGTAQTALGLPVLEAMAAGVPVVQPRVGAFVEIVRKTGGGILYDPGDANALFRALDQLVGDPEQRAILGARGREGVRRHFALDTMVESLHDLYLELTSRAELHQSTPSSR